MTHTASIYFKMTINGRDVNCKLSQDAHGTNVETLLTVGDRIVEDSTGGQDCWLDLDAKDDAFAKDYATCAILAAWDCAECDREADEAVAGDMEREANGRLIAAAPDGYALAEMIEQANAAELPHGLSLPEAKAEWELILKTARAFIAKAEGK